MSRLPISDVDSLTSRRSGSAIAFSHGLPSEDLQRCLHLIEPGPGHHGAVQDYGVLIADLSEPEPMTRFPVYASTALGGCVRSVSVIPLGTVAARLGTLEFYRHWPQALAGEELDAALSFAAMITDVLGNGPADRGEAPVWPQLALSLSNTVQPQANVVRAAANAEAIMDRRLRAAGLLTSAAVAAL